jgi:WXG100 family type VII secretion target
MRTTSRRRPRCCGVSTVAEAFRVDPEALADAVARMAEYVRYAENMLGDIDSLVTNLHLTWSGEAAEAHVAAHRHWAAGAAMMREALALLKAAGTIAHANYTGVMAANLGMWS